MGIGILDGVRVLDFTWVLAGPYATRILADFGAEVIKVQSKKTAPGVESNLAGYFRHWNRNKRSITLDMEYPESKELVLRLVRISDVVVENFSPRVMENWGLGYERLKEVKPDLIMLSLSAFGQSGPWKNFVAFGPTLQALSGLSYLTSYSKEFPVGIGYAYSDIISGLYGALSILAALEFRDRTGKGQYIDLSQYEALCTVIGPTFLDLFVNHKVIGPQGNRSQEIPASPYGCYRCRGEDRWCVIAVFNEEEWEKLCRIMGNPPWTKEPRFSTLSNRKDNEEELDRLIEKWTTNYPPEQIVDMLQKEGISAGVVQDARDLVEDPQLKAREFFIQLEHPLLGKTLGEASPIRFKGNSRLDWKAAPLLGQDNHYVFTKLIGLTEEQYSSYVEKGIIG
jgi:crotonobetainyl-CoA:carnitine CoA-transferase CaiB-like acyl-CoA transferase